MLSILDQELAAKIGSEITLEKEMRDADEVPVSVKDYLKNGLFQVHDTPGNEEVLLTRQFGDESIRVAFSIADLNNLDQEESDKFDDSALYDEDDDQEADEPSGKRNRKAASAQSASSALAAGGDAKGDMSLARGKVGANVNDGHEAADDDDDDEADTSSGSEGQEPSFPARLTVTIEKAGTSGAFQIETVAQDGMIGIENAYYYPDAALANPQTAEQELARRDQYLGPPFANLDEDLQVLLERYLDERGINTALALFVPDYVDYKEQREYLRWLGDVKSFIEV
ncbi:MAG: hypothetical protein M1826_000850 [Phylliscum demangeonii]|nr:MAG: hypothetical protein M1826_000850 [Phylliscum demangeonii]